MKRLVCSGLSVLLVMVASAPAFAAGKMEDSNAEICQSIPPAQPTGGATRERLEAMARCELQAMVKQQQAMMDEMHAMESQMQAMESQMQVMKLQMESIQKELSESREGR